MPARSSSEPPLEERFPRYPASWYLFCDSRELDRGPLSKSMVGRRLVVFRTAGGRLGALDARCSHMGADLGKGQVVGEELQCPYHHWRYGCQGSCTHIPGGGPIPRFARQRTYPVEERHGHIFIFNGREPLFPLPFVLGEEPDNFVAGKPFRYVADCTWYMNAVHAFDRQHFAAVHDRKLLTPPSIDCPAPFARRNSYRAEVVGDSIFDRLLRTFVGRTVDITLTIWGGTFAVITARFERLQSAFLMSMLPLEDGQTLCEGIVLTRRSSLPHFDRMSLAVRRLFTHGYLADEARLLRGTRYQRRSLTERDQDMIDFFTWVVELPTPKEENDEKEPLDPQPGPVAGVSHVVAAELRGEGSGPR